MLQILTHQYMSDSELRIWPHVLGKANVEEIFLVKGYPQKHRYSYFLALGRFLHGN